MVPCDGGALEGDPAAGRGYRRRRRRAELRLPARHERARHGLGRRARCRNISRWSRAGASSTRRMPVIVKLTPNITDILAPARAAQARRRRCGVADQHHQLDHRRRSRPDGAGADGRRQGHAWRLLRPGGQADRAAHGGRDRARPERRGLPISGIGGITTWRDAAEFIALGAGTVQVCTAAMHLRLQDRRGHDRRAVELDGREGLSHARRFPRPRGDERHRLAVPQPELQDAWRASTRICASSAAAATSPARTPRTRRSRR